MDNIPYLMATKQNSSFQHLDVVSNNVANSNTTGFKEDSLVFEKYLVQDAKEKTAFGKVKTSISDMTEGPVKVTMRDLDVALKGPGYFMVMTPLGPRYTRNGNFHLSDENKLVDATGNPVLSSDGQEIVFEDEDSAPVISEDGSIYIKEAKRGEIGMIEFENPSMLRKFGNGMFSAKSAGNPAEKTIIAQGVLETSNVNSVMQITKLIEINREIALSANMINEYYSSQRNMFRNVSKTGGSN